MYRIRYEKYNLLEFSGLENSILKLCLGVIGYLFLEREGKSHISYIPSKFIQCLRSKCKIDLIQYLILNNYIIVYKTPLTEDELRDLRYGIKYKIFDENYKKPANLYLLTNKLRALRKIILLDKDFEIFIDKHLHYLNGLYFNHYENSYKHIKISDVPREVYSLLDEKEKNILFEYGHPEVKNYNILDFGFDTKYSGTHVNLFTKNKHLISYTNLVIPLEIGLIDSEVILLADQLLKTVGKNDFSNYFSKRKYQKPFFNKEGNLVAWHKEPLYNSPNDYDLFTEISRLHFRMAAYGYEQINEFRDLFPKAWNLLYLIKKGVTDKGENYIGFTSNLKMPIFKNDIRLQIEDNHPAYKRGQKFYKIISLVIMIRQTEIMRKIFLRLKKCDIRFIPLENSVVISRMDEEPTLYIFNEVLNEFIDKKLKFGIYKTIFYL